MNCACGQDFEPRQGKGGRPQRYCSERCANKARQQRNRDRQQVPTVTGYDVKDVTNTIIQGDALAVLKRLPDACVQCVVTSPPYFGLRDYGVVGQIGLEASPQEYIAALVAVCREVRRVLKPDGVFWCNIGDSYAGGGRGAGGKQEYLQQILGPRQLVSNGFKPKDLMMIPARIAIALQADGWYLRSDSVWFKPNCLPESVEDHPTKSHEYVFLLAKNERYYYDADAIAEPTQYGANGSSFTRGKTGHHDNQGKSTYDFKPTRNKRSVWQVNTQPFPEAHFAVMPQKLVEPCILAGSRPGDIILDPFFGAGTVGLVARKLSRNYIGIELNAEYIALAQKRIEVVQPQLWTGSEAV